ncbi:MAG: hypothetical protein LBT03_02070 [Holosporales bacterium]|jgi:transposase-like protein|nr:hypothetical protein [Holosporales bacterium]
MLKICRKCNSENIVKYRFAKGGNQRYKCKQCGKVFNDRKSRGKPQAMKDLAVLFHTVFAASFRSIGKILGVRCCRIQMG